MVCLTSCVFRSIRFSGFARPHRLGCGARENYTRTCGRGQAWGRRYMRRTQIGEEWLFRALSRPRKAGLRRPWPRGGAQAERPPPAERPPAAGGVATSPAHQGRTPSYAAPLPESADNGPAPQTTGLSRPGRPGLSVGQGTGTRASPLGGQSRPPNVLRVWRYAHSNPLENWRQARLAP